MPVTRPVLPSVSSVGKPSVVKVLANGLTVPVPTWIEEVCVLLGEVDVACTPEELRLVPFIDAADVWAAVLV